MSFQEPDSQNEPGTFFARPLARSFKGVRIAWFKDLGGIPFDPRVRAIVDGHRATFESLGCIVEKAEPDFQQLKSAFACCALGTQRMLMVRDCRAFFERFEYFVLPTTQLPPFDVTMRYPTEIVGVKTMTG